MLPYLSSREFISSPEFPTYSPEDIALLLVGSFRFSRGNSNAQDAILAYLAVEHRRKFTAKSIDQAIPSAIDKAFRIFTNPKSHPYSQGFPETDMRVVKDNIESYAADIDKYLRSPNRYKINATALTKQMLESDEKWLPHKREHRAEPQPLKLYRSNIIHFGLLGRPTGRVEYDDMFSAVISNLTSQPPYRQQQFAEVVSQHIHYRPQERESVEQALAQATQ